MIEIKVATPEDAPGILEIYAPNITKSFSTFENEVPSVEEMAMRIKKYLETRPWLVCKIDNRIASYVYASLHRERAAYQWCCESSVYTHDDFQGIGIGYHLYKILFQILKIQGYRNVYAGITLPNIPSIKLHEKCGFIHVATYENVGYKLGEWKSVGWWNLQVNQYSRNPLPPQPFPEINPAQFEHPFQSAAELISKKLAY